MKMKIENIFGGRKLLAAMFVAMLAMVCIGGMVAVSDNGNEEVDATPVATAKVYVSLAGLNVSSSVALTNLTQVLANASYTVTAGGNFGFTLVEAETGFSMPDSISVTRNGEALVKETSLSTGYTYASGAIAVAGPATSAATDVYVITAVAKEFAGAEKISGNITADKIVAGKDYIVDADATIPAGVTITFENEDELIIASNADLVVKGTLVLKDYIVAGSGNNVTPAIYVSPRAGGDNGDFGNVISIINNGQVIFTSIGLKSQNVDPAKVVESSVKATSVTSNTIYITQIGYNIFNKAGVDVKADDTMIKFEIWDNAIIPAVGDLTTGSIAVYGNIADSADLTFAKNTSFTVGQSVEGAPASIFALGNALTFDDKTASFTIVDAIVNIDDNPIGTQGAISVTGDSVLYGTGKVTLYTYDASFTAEAGVVLGLTSATGGITFDTDEIGGTPAIMGSITFGAYLKDAGAAGDESVVVAEGGITVKAVKGDATLDTNDDYEDLFFNDNVQISGAFIDHANPASNGENDAIGKVTFTAEATSANAMIFTENATFGGNLNVTFDKIVVVDEEVEMSFAARASAKLTDAILLVSPVGSATGNFRVYGNVNLLGKNADSTVDNNGTISVLGNGVMTAFKNVDGVAKVYAVSYTSEEYTVYNFAGFATVFGANAPVADDNKYTITSDTTTPSALVVVDGDYNIAADMEVVSPAAGAALDLSANAMVTIASGADFSPSITFANETPWTDDATGAEIHAGALKAMGYAPAGTTINLAAPITAEDDVIIIDGVTVITSATGTLTVNKGVTLTVLGDVTVTNTAQVVNNGYLVVAGGDIVNGENITNTEGEITVTSGTMTGVPAAALTGKINGAMSAVAPAALVKLTNIADAKDDDFWVVGTVNSEDFTIPMNVVMTLGATNGGSPSIGATLTANVTLTTDTASSAPSDIVISDKSTFRGTITMGDDNIVEINEVVAGDSGAFVGKIIYGDNVVTLDSAKVDAVGNVTFASVKEAGTTASSVTVATSAVGVGLLGSYSFDGNFTSAAGLKIGATGVIKATGGKFDANIDINGGKYFIGTGATSIEADTVVYKGAVTFTGASLLVVFPNANMADGNTSAATVNSVFYIEDKVYMTEYGGTTAVGYDLTAPAIPGYKFTGWKNVAGELVKTTDNVGTFDKIYADITEVTYAVTLGAVTGADYVIDGIAYSAGSIAYLTAGTHTVSLSAKAGYDVSKATISAAAGGKVTVTGSSLTVAGEGIIGATGVTEKAAGMSITDILMIVLVVVVVILAIVIVMRLMRS